MDEQKTIETLRRDLFLANVNRGMVLTAILREMRKELGDEKASAILKQAIYNHGVNTAKFFTPPDNLKEFKDWLLDFFPGEGKMNVMLTFRRQSLVFAGRLYAVSLA